MKKAVIFLVTASVLLVAGYAFADYRIGNITTTTGPYSSMGVSNTEGINLLLDKINKAGGIHGEKVVILTEDHEGEASKALTIAKKMIYDDKVIGIIGATNTAGSMAVSRICNEAKIPQVQLAPKPSSEPTKRYTFQTVPDNDIDAEAIGNFAVKDLGLKKLAILHDTNAYGTTGAESQVKFFQKMKVEIVAIEKYKQDDRDMTASLLKIKNAGADGLIVWGTVNVPSIIAKDMKRLGINIPFIGSTGVLSAKFIELGGEAVNGCYTTAVLNFGSPLPEEKELFEVTRAKLNKDPNYFTSLGWDGLLLFSKALDIAKSKDPEKIRDALESIKGFPGTVGVYNMSPEDHTGLSYKDMRIIKITEGKPTAYKAF
jgi:branched-chain amino acid transport system substrate-binding protein